ncbi:MAG: hypothetical protein LBN27_14060 [Prevotellaceae bacterium]|jgi:hypothetical protein|nr:hypothetical protein [Prevotellaceae bacterium]
MKKINLLLLFFLFCGLSAFSQVFNIKTTQSITYNANTGTERTKYETCEHTIDFNNKSIVFKGYINGRNTVLKTFKIRNIQKDSYGYIVYGANKGLMDVVFNPKQGDISYSFEDGTTIDFLK